MNKLILFVLLAVTTQTQAFIFECDQGVTLDLGANLAEVSFENEEGVASGQIVTATKKEVFYAMDSWINFSGQIFDSAEMYVSMKLMKKDIGLISVIANFEGTTYPFEYQCRLKK